MTQTLLALAPTKQSHTDLVEAYFRAHPRTWISALHILEIGGVL